MRRSNSTGFADGALNDCHTTTSKLTFGVATAAALELLRSGAPTAPEILNRRQSESASNTELGALCSRQPVPLGLKVPLEETQGSDRSSYSRTETATSALV
jgi:hypothetical protein